MNRIFCSIVLLLIFFIGCDLAEPQGKKNKPDETPTINISTNTSVPEAIPDNENSSPQQSPSAETELPKTEMESPKTETEQQLNENNKPAESEPEKIDKPESELVNADVGAGKKGHYGQTGGEQVSDIITVPVATLFRAKEMTAFRIQVPQALQLYKAMNDNQAPQTHEAFMKDIIQANNIPLPELPEGHEYIYDPATEQLMIKKPK
ncbi:MAG: hypothetical protein LBP87_01040 [Planctomycetaceae bacterium]|jgi:hypothetical protein|nr:hypothetical protein [Planctomycetaceae bacterium]